MVLGTLAFGAAVAGAGYLIGQSGKNKSQSNNNFGTGGTGYYGGYTYPCYYGKQISILINMIKIFFIC